MASSLPKFSRGLKLSRIGIIVMLIQLALTFLMTLKSVAISDEEGAMSMIEWTGYLMLANVLSTSLLLIGVATSIAELRRVGVNTTGILIAVAGFALATLAMLWTYHVYSELVDALLGVRADDGSYEQLEQLERVTADLESLTVVAIAKDLGYGLGLISLAKMIQRSAAANDQLALRDDAGHMSRAIIVMAIGDLFYQLTYGLGGSVGLLGMIGSLLVGCYWIWCHLKLVRFFENAAHFVNEPHDLPTATVLKVPDAMDLKGPAARASRPSMPRVPDANRTSSPQMPARTSSPAIPARTSSPALPARTSSPALPARTSSPALPDGTSVSEPAPAQPPIVVVRPALAPAPRAPSASSDDAPAVDGPKFLR